MPCSAMVGMSGISSERSSLKMPITRTLPERWYFSISSIRRHGRRHMAADQVGDQRRRALVGRDGQVDAGCLGELHAEEVVLPAEPGRAEAWPAGCFFTQSTNSRTLVAPVCRLTAMPSG